MRHHAVRSSRSLAGRLLVAASLALAATGAGAVASGAIAGDPCYHDLTRPPVSDEAVAEVAIAECSFEPTIARVAPGTTVRFVNRASQDHLVTGANLAWGSADVPVVPRAAVTETFSRRGVYPYTCLLHPGMTGVIVVAAAEAPGAAAPAAEPPTGSGSNPSSELAAVGLVAGATGLALVVGLALGLLAGAFRHRRELGPDGPSSADRPASLPG